MSNTSENLDHIIIPSTNEPLVEDILVAREQNELLEDKLRNAKLNRFEVDTKLRTHLTYIFSLVIFLWLASVVSVIFFNNYLLLHLSDKVLIVLLTTTSINVIGMMLIILKNLFPKND